MKKIPLISAGVMIIVGIIAWNNGVKSQPAIRLSTRPDKQDNIAVRVEAIKSLGKIVHASAFPALQNCLDDSSALVRQQAALALGECNQKSFVASLKKLLDDKSDTVKFAAAASIARLGGKEGKDFIKARLISPDPVQRLLAISVLRFCGGGGEAASQQNESEVTSAPGEYKQFETMLNDQDAKVRARAAEFIGDSRNSKYIPSLAKLITDSDGNVRNIAAIALGEIGDAQAIASLYHSLSDPDPVVQLSAIEALGKVGDKWMIPLFKQRLSDSNERVRIIAACALARLGDLTTIPFFLRSLDSEDPYVCWRAAEKLRELKAGYLPVAVTANLGELGTNLAVDYLWHGKPLMDEVVSGLNHPDWKIRRNCAIIITEMKYELAIPLLLKLLEDESLDVRLLAIKAVGDLKAKAAVEKLVSFIS